jgi:prepilin-type N-terminal cleavage/methylation domain-containing protein
MKDAHDKMATMKWAKTNSGFTIVELLIVIVVIAILAAITIVSYNGISQRARASTLQNDLSSAIKKIETTKISSGIGIYPSTTEGMGVSQTITYYYTASMNTYCIEAKDSTQFGSAVYSATSINQTITGVPCSQRGLLGWWKLNNNGDDSSPLGHTSTVSGTTPTTSYNGALNGALSFSSASQSYVQVPDSSALNNAKSFSFWIRPTSWASPTASVVIAKRNNSTNGFFISFINTLDVLSVDCGASGGSNRWPTNFKPPLNTWSHIVVTCANEDGLKLYVNGLLQDQRANVDTTPMTLSTANLRIGRDTTSSSAEFYFNGGIDDVRLFDRVLTLGEAGELYNESTQ